MGFFYDNVTIEAIAMFLIYFTVLWLLNSFALKSKGRGFFMYFIVPILGVFILWPITTKGTNMDNWFSHAKVLSSVALCVIFYGLRYFEKVRAIKWYKLLPAIFLAVNMIEAVVRELQIGTLNAPQVIDGMEYIGGPWNQINAVAGILNILLICGWFGIFVMKDRNHTMSWPDMTWAWIIGYDLWNQTYAYNALGDRSFYAFAVLFSATVIAHREGKGAWLQHRASTLAISNYIMFTFPHLLVTSDIAVQSSWNTQAMMLLSITALTWNIVLFTHQVGVIVKGRKNPFTQELYTDTDQYKRYQEIRAEYEANPVK